MYILPAAAHQRVKVNRSCYSQVRPRATLSVFSHANIETTRSKGVHCMRWENIRTCRSAF